MLRQLPKKVVVQALAQPSPSSSTGPSEKGQVPVAVHGPQRKN